MHTKLCHNFQIYDWLINYNVISVLLISQFTAEALIIISFEAMSNYLRFKLLNAQSATFRSLLNLGNSPLVLKSIKHKAMFGLKGFTSPAFSDIIVRNLVRFCLKLLAVMSHPPTFASLEFWLQNPLKVLNIGITESEFTICWPKKFAKGFNLRRYKVPSRASMLW